MKSKSEELMNTERDKKIEEIRREIERMDSMPYLWRDRKRMDELRGEYIDLKMERDEEIYEKEFEEKDNKLTKETLALLSEKTTDKDIDKWFEPLNNSEMNLLIYKALDMIKRQLHDSRDLFRLLKSYWLKQDKPNTALLKQHDYSGDYDGKKNITRTKKENEQKN